MKALGIPALEIRSSWIVDENGRTHLIYDSRAIPERVPQHVAERHVPERSMDVARLVLKQRMRIRERGGKP